MGRSVETKTGKPRRVGSAGLPQSATATVREYATPRVPHHVTYVLPLYASTELPKSVSAEPETVEQAADRRPQSRAPLRLWHREAWFRPPKPSKAARAAF